jgi:phosphatidate cytidylyltransferase
VRSNLRVRIITALVLAALVLGTLATQSTGLWALLVTFFCAAAAWEFGRLMTKATAAKKLLSTTLLLLLVASFAYLLFAFNGVGSASASGFAASTTPQADVVFHYFFVIAALFWLVVVPWQLSRRNINLATWPSVLMMPVAIGAAWLAAVLLQRAGAQFLIAVVVVTVVADVSGYFVGRAFGRVKLAPTISPGKTREGAIGGIVAAALWAVAASLYLGLISGSALFLVVALVGAFLGAFAVIGDLWESQLKRQAGAKDSSQLLPGHGGVLDRIDAQLTVLPLATLLISLVKPLW